MKIDGRFNIPDFNTYNDVKDVRGTQSVDSFSSRIESMAASDTQAPAISPLRSALTDIAKSVDMNNSVMSRVAIDRAARAIVSGLIGPEVQNRINVEAMLDRISDFAQNDPVLSQRLRSVLERLA